ncbi:MAG: hypothetical protein IT299_11585 [Dehalococcoidia bacterium]|nr:hypothetical protein [Dehalococcoidia bacterium]
MRSSAYSQRRSRRGRVAAVLFTSIALAAACSSADAPSVRASSSNGPAPARSREYLGEPAPRNDGVTVVLLLAGAVSVAVAQRAVHRYW